MLFIFIMPFQPKTHKQPSAFAKASYQNSYDDKRLSSSARGYDNSWRVVRKQHLTNSPLCELCLKEGRYVPGQDIHHKVKLRDRPDLRDDSTNLQTLCHSCHSTLTAEGQ